MFVNWSLQRLRIFDCRGTVQLADTAELPIFIFNIELQIGSQTYRNSESDQVIFYSVILTYCFIRTVDYSSSK